MPLPLSKILLIWKLIKASEPSLLVYVSLAIGLLAIVAVIVTGGLMSAGRESTQTQLGIHNISTVIALHPMIASAWLLLE